MNNYLIKIVIISILALGAFEAQATDYTQSSIAQTDATLKQAVINATPR